ncbi:MAG: GerAB/ArcD/ProY family transporter [Clostridia bacterium]|nr:GerAB/ArcD/ProY family transporter [Clostridia bacterium]
MNTKLKKGINKISEKTISIRQAGIMLFFLSFSNKILLLPSMLYNYAKTDSFFIYLILFLLDIFLLFVFVFLKKRYINKSFFDIFSKKFGIFIAKTIYFLFLIYFLTKIVLLFNVSFFYFRDQIYKSISPYIYLICIIPVLNHAMLIGLRPVGRSMEFFYNIILFAVVLCVGISFVNLNNFEGFFITKISDFSLGLFKHLFCFGDYVCMFFIMDKIQFKKNKEKIYFIYSAIGILSVLAIVLMFYLIYGSTAFLHVNAISDIINFSNNYGEIGRLDIISMLLVMFLTYFQLNIYGNCFSECFSKVFNKLSTVYSVVSLDLAFLFCVIFIFNSLQTISFSLRNIFPYLSILSFVCIPIISFVCLLSDKKGEKNRYEKNF